MDNLPQSSILLALSQLVQQTLVRGRHEIALKRTMPFLSLQTAAHKLGQGSYSQANRLIDLEWGEPHVTHVSRETHHQTNITKLSEPVTAQSAIQGQGHKGDANSAAAGVSPADIANAVTTESQPHKINSDAADSQLYKTNSDAAESQLHKTNSGAADSINDGVEHSIINRSLAYRPLFIQSRQLKGEPTSREHLAQARRRQMPEMVGLLSGKRHRRQKQTANSTQHKQASGEPSETAAAVLGAGLSWSLALPAAHGGHQESDPDDLARQSLNSTLPPNRLPEVRPVDTSHAESSNIRLSGSPGDIGFAQDASRESKAEPAIMPYGKIQAQLPGGQFDGAMNFSNTFSEMPSMIPGEQFDFAMNFKASPAGLAPGLPPNLPHRKPQGYPLGEDLDSGAKLSNSVAQKIETLVLEKVDTMTRADNRNKISIDEVRHELKTRLKPESLVSEEMIKILLRKLQKTLREERFRMGLMS